MGNNNVCSPESLVGYILRNLMGRSGFDAWWEEIDPDVQNEIRETLASIAAPVMMNYVDYVNGKTLR